jgi:hypothetical protein
MSSFNFLDNQSKPTITITVSELPEWLREEFERQRLERIVQNVQELLERKNNTPPDFSEYFSEQNVERFRQELREREQQQRKNNEGMLWMTTHGFF